MTGFLKTAKRVTIGRIVAVGALAAVGAAGLSTAPASAYTVSSSGYNNSSNGNQNGSNSNSVSTTNNSGSQTSASYKEYTKYVYFENFVEANFDTSEFSNSTYQQKNMQDFAKSFGIDMAGYMNFLNSGYGNKY